jgi:hypothetical protein
MIAVEIVVTTVEGQIARAVVAVVHADERVDLGDCVAQAGAVALGETAGHNDSPQRPTPLTVRQPAQHIQRFLPRRAQKPAGIDHHRVSHRLSAEQGPRLGDLREHLFRVHQVLDATQRHEGNDRHGVPLAGAARGRVLWFFAHPR